METLIPEDYLTYLLLAQVEAGHLQVSFDFMDQEGSSSPSVGK